MFVVTSVAQSSVGGSPQASKKTGQSFIQYLGDNINEFSVKTNALLLFPLVANIEMEQNIGKQWSLCVPIVYSPYVITSSVSFRLLMLQPALRWWMSGQQQQGGFLNVHAHTGYYSVGWGKELYQTHKDVNGDPFYGAGIGCGYAVMSEGGHWMLEFEIGLGYAHFEYDIYENAAKGKYLGYGTQNYWGVTKAGIGIGYRF
ncbi:hypothetical protein FACS189452_07310 [Bacteroidia bacterium]|nr:hypothetical protein FACS189452_07310 [Bacteroidia bacterium]